MTQNNRFVGFVNLGFSQNLNHERRSIDQEDSWESTDAVPNLTWDSLNRSYNNNVLLLALQVLCSKRKDKVHDGWVNTTNNYMVFKLREEMVLRNLHLSLWFWKSLIILKDVHIHIFAYSSWLLRNFWFTFGRFPLINWRVHRITLSLITEKRFLILLLRVVHIALLLSRYLTRHQALLLVKCCCLKLVRVLTLVLLLVPQSSKEPFVLLILHLELLDFSSDINVLTDDIETIAVQVPVGEQEAVGVQSDDWLGHVHARLDLKGEHNCAVLWVGHLGDLVESDVVLVVLLWDGHAIDLMAHSFGVLFKPIEWDDIGINFSCRSNQVGDHGNQPRRETGFGKEIHLDFLNNNQLILEWRKVQWLVVEVFWFWLNELHADSNVSWVVILWIFLAIVVIFLDS